MSYGNHWLLEQRPDALLLRSNGSDKTFGLFAIGAAIALAIFTNTTSELPATVGNAASLVLLAMGLWAILPREITTTFDLRKRQMRQTEAFALGSYRRKSDAEFSDIASIGLDKYADEGVGYVPKIRLTNGEVHRLCVGAGTPEMFSSDLDLICALTQLKRADLTA